MNIDIDRNRHRDLYWCDLLISIHMVRFGLYTYPTLTSRSVVLR